MLLNIFQVTDNNISAANNISAYNTDQWMGGQSTGWGFTKLLKQSHKIFHNLGP